MEGPDVAPYDALLLVSFGGPEKPEDVVPFLENVTAGRGIPRERLVEVGEHYALFGGRSPINDLNRDLLAGIEAELNAAGIDLPGLLGQPQLGPLPHRRRAAHEGRRGDPGGLLRHQRLLVLVELPPVPREPLRRRVGGARGARCWTSCATTSTIPGFVEPVVDAVLAALAGLADDVRAGAHLAFVTHSIPLSMAETADRPVRRMAGRTSPSTSTSWPR